MAGFKWLMQLLFYFIHRYFKFALFDKAAKQYTERYTWKTDNYYSNKTEISIADAT
jgi:hypothetical protein